MAEPSLGPEGRRLGAGRLFGLDRSGPAPPQTLAGAPLRPWTIPNAIGYLRAALVVVFLITSLTGPDHDHVDTVAALCYLVAALGDYADGITARLTGQYSRLGTLMDPVIDRVMVIAGIAVCWDLGLLPRWAIALLVVREVMMLVVGRLWIAHGLRLEINWPGRIAVGPTMLGIFLGLCGSRTVGEAWLYAGLALALLASGLYAHTGITQLREPARR